MLLDPPFNLELLDDVMRRLVKAEVLETQQPICLGGVKGRLVCRLLWIIRLVAGWDTGMIFSRCVHYDTSVSLPH